ncbi:MAG TPA: DUF3465 domain-containing protein [Candidatus Baltobacteraceae bacterium]|jgi:hypothetical protein|nr:DUF3465 domain-containing protein [Candidatus Baltobacteraceae bacterium]
MRKALALAMFLGLSGCSGAAQTPDNARICTLYAAQQSHAEVVASGKIVDVLGTRGGPSGGHEGYLLHLESGCDTLVRVETNVDLTGPVPLRSGEAVVVKGEYEYTPLGGVIHWTHRDPRGRHEGGYVIAAGKTYE